MKKMVLAMAFLLVFVMTGSVHSMELALRRVSLGAGVTVGTLEINGVKECITLENVVRDVRPDGSGIVYNETAIPAGEYQVIIDYSNKFMKFAPHVLSVPFFNEVRIYFGDTRGDIKDGVILVGRNMINKDRIQGGTSALRVLQQKIKNAQDAGEKIMITIFDEFPR